MKLAKRVIQAVDKAGVEVFQCDRTIAKMWNGWRRQGDPIFYSGWYWVKGWTEAGPFKTKSAAIRDAHTRVVQGEKLRTPGRNRR